MKNYSHKIVSFVTGTFLLTTLVLSPVLVSAKDNSNENRNKNSNRNEKSSIQMNVRDSDDDDSNTGNTTSGTTTNSNCVQAFGHLIAPGWIKHNGQLSIGDDCHLPFGIGELFGWRNGTTTNGTTTPPVDTTAPIISTITSTASTTDVKIAWMTNEYSNSKVFYSASSTFDINSSSTLNVNDDALRRNHSIDVTGLTASTTYYFVVESVDASGNVASSSIFYVNTNSSGPVVDTTAPIISSALAIIGSSTVNLSWNTNENATTKAYYSTSTPVDVNASTTPFVVSTNLVTTHALTVSSLATSTKYYMILESQDASGNTVRTSEFTFTTSSGI